MILKLNFWSFFSLHITFDQKLNDRMQAKKAKNALERPISPGTAINTDGDVSGKQYPQSLDPLALRSHNRPGFPNLEVAVSHQPFQFLARDAGQRSEGCPGDGSISILQSAEGDPIYFHLLAIQKLICGIRMNEECV
jgi:hypothetical protein